MGDANGTPAGQDTDPVSTLEARLETKLADRQLALAALTHKSYVNEHRDEGGLADNERLEFLGDAVIDLAVSHRLMERFPDAREGDLSKMRAAVVDEQGLAEMARALDLGGLLRLGRGEELTGGRRKASLLADAMEAVIAAVYVGSGLPAVLGVVDRFLGGAFDRATAGTLDRDFKTQLQELAQSRLRATPRYRVVAEHGPDHSKTFDVETDLRGEVLGRGTGRSKKDAEQAAARLALDRLGRRFVEVAVPPGTAAPEPERAEQAALAAAVRPPEPPAATPQAAVEPLAPEPPAAEPPLVPAGEGGAGAAAVAPRRKRVAKSAPKPGKAAAKPARKPAAKREREPKASPAASRPRKAPPRSARKGSRPRR